MIFKMPLFFLFLICLISIPFIHATDDMNKKAIVFDFGGVIAKTDREAVAEFIAESLKISKQEAADSLLKLKAHYLQDKTELDFWTLYAEANQIQLPENWVEKLDQTRKISLKEIPGMIQVVKTLKLQGYTTALLSNVRNSQARIKSLLGYYDLFHPKILSHQCGFRKPDPAAYQFLLDELKLPPEQIIFIDNKKPNIEAAQALGMDAIEFINPPQLIEALKQRGIDIQKN